VQPLILFITTAGSTASHVWIEQYKYACGIARDEFRDESYFSLNYEMDEEDDVFDEVNFIKANPCLGVTCQPEYLRDQMLPAMTDKLVENRWRRYHCNQMVTNTDAAFNMDEWDACAGELSDWNDADALGCGVDIGGRDDLASFSIVARFDTGEVTQVDEDSEPQPIYRYEGRTWQYLATDSERDTTVKPFVDFLDDGLIRTSKYPVSELEKDLVRKCYEYGCQEVAFDPFGAQKTGEYVETEGLIPMSMTQSCRMFNEPITILRQCIKDGRFAHDGNPCLRWMMSNAVLIEDRNERVMYSKKDSAEKIDGCVAMTMALSRAMHAPPRTSGYFIT
jgi:phage terminase large subunit-like protein